MLILKRGLMAVGALALAAMLLNFVAPKAAHALVATAVQVMNTSATPVPTLDTGEPGRHPYVLRCATTETGECFTGPVPAGTTFVSDSVWIQTQATSWPVRLTGTAGGTQYELALPPETSSGVGSLVFVTNLITYADAGTQLSVTANCSSAGGCPLSTTIIGHLVSTP
jgi:hypothetical protein